MSAEVVRLSQGLERLLRREDVTVVWRDPEGRETRLDASVAASPAGLLPALVVAGEAVWRGATGSGFALDLVADRDALLGWRLRGIGAGGFARVMLATLEAASQASDRGRVAAHDLARVWSVQALPWAEVAARPASGARP